MFRIDLALTCRRRGRAAWSCCAHMRTCTGGQLPARSLGSSQGRIRLGLRGSSRHQLEVVLRGVGAKAKHHPGVLGHQRSHRRIELGLGNAHRAQQPERPVHALRIILQDRPDARKNLALGQRLVLARNARDEEEPGAPQPRAARMRCQRT